MSRRRAAESVPGWRPPSWDKFRRDARRNDRTRSGPLSAITDPRGFYIYVSYRRFAEALACANTLAGLYNKRYRVRQSIPNDWGAIRWTVTWIEPS